MKLESLLRWREAHPGTWPNDSAADARERRLGEWLSYQRHMKAALESGNHAQAEGMTPERARRLEAALPGLVWDPEAQWEASLASLVSWRADNGPSSSWPSTASADPRTAFLAEWVLRQRREKRALDAGDARRARGMKPERAARLEAAVPGWTWAAAPGRRREGR